jgi:hypothetical protein
MIHTVNFPTRLQNNHASAIANVFVDESRLFSCITLSYAMHCLIMMHNVPYFTNILLLLIKPTINQ